MEMPTPFRAKLTRTAHRTISLRALRLWHWRKAMAASERRRFYENKGEVRYRFEIKQQNRQYSFHIKCVQTLNDVVTGTAEQDDKADT